MFDRALLKYYISRKGITLDKLANELGINPSTLNRKMCEQTEFTRTEIKIIRNYLELSIEEAESIFFS